MVPYEVREGVRWLFSKDCLNHCGQIVVKPWHHRRKAEGGRVMLFFAGSFQTGAPPTQGRAGAQSQLVATEELHHAIIVVCAECRIHRKDVGKDKLGKEHLPKFANNRPQFMPPEEGPAVAGQSSMSKSSVRRVRSPRLIMSQ